MNKKEEVNKLLAQSYWTGFVYLLKITVNSSMRVVMTFGVRLHKEGEHGLADFLGFYGLLIR